MIVETSAIILQSDMNKWIDICIAVEPYEDFYRVKEIASRAYDEWFELDTDECIGEYIERKLNEAECGFKMYFGDFNADEEDE